MSLDDLFDAVDGPPPSRDHDTHPRGLRAALLDMDAEEMARQLPNLVETVAEHAADDVPTLQFVIGVSFSRNETLLDYRLDRLVVIDRLRTPHLETLKPPVSARHEYLTFRYPPDPTFDAKSFRGALLAATERQLADRGWPMGDEEANGGEGDGPGSLWGELRRQLRGRS